MGKTLYLIKQTVPDTATDASANADDILNTVLDAIKDLSTTDVSNVIISTDASSTHLITDYSSGKLLNSDLYSDIFDQQFSAFVSEYQDQTSWSQNDGSYNDGNVEERNLTIGYDPAITSSLATTIGASPESAPLYDATIFITTQEQNTAYTKNDERFAVEFNQDASGTYQVFKAINSSTYRSDGTSGLTIEDVSFNVNAGLTEYYVVRNANNELSIDYQSNSGHRLTQDASFVLTYSNDFSYNDVSYGSFKVTQTPASSSVLIHVNDISANASDLFISDQSGNDLPSTITADQIAALFSDSGNIGTSYSISITNNRGGGYSFDNTTKVSANNNVTINDDSLTQNFDYMKLLTGKNSDYGSLVNQALVWTNGSVDSSGTYATNVIIGVSGETLGISPTSDYDSSGLVHFYPSDPIYSSTSSELQRSTPSNWNTYDTLAVDYATLPDDYKSYQSQELETRVLLPSTYSPSLATYNPYAVDLSNRYIDQSYNMVFIKANTNNVSIDPLSITVSATSYYDTSANSDYATIIELASSKAFTNQSSLLEQQELDGSYSVVPGSIVSIVATNVNISDATDYRFIMNPKQISGNYASASFDFPDISNGTAHPFTFTAYDSSNGDYAATNKLETLKSNMNILGNDIYSIINNSYDVYLTMTYNTNGSATNADSLKNYFDISYSANAGAIAGSHRIEDLDRMTILELDSSYSESVYVASLLSGDITGEPPQPMTGWKIVQIEETSTFKVRTQLYLGAYSNLYIETPTIKQVDTRYEVRTASGVAKPDYYLKYIQNHTVTASRVLKLNATLGTIGENTVTLSVDDLKSHYGDIQYTSGTADNDEDINWDSIAGPQIVDPNFDSANLFEDSNSGSYKVYIDVPKTTTLDAPQYLIRMQADAASLTATAYLFDPSNNIFTDSSYSFFDIHTTSLSSYKNSSIDLSLSYVTDVNNNTTITVSQDTHELFNLQLYGDITQNVRVIHNPLGIVETKYLIDDVQADILQYFGTENAGTIEYYPATGLTLQLDHRYRDTSSTSSYWSLNNDTVTLQRVNTNSDYYDLSYQRVGIDGSFNTNVYKNDFSWSPTYGTGSDGAKQVSFKYYRGNSLGNDSTVSIIRTPSTLKYEIQVGTTVSTTSGYGDVYTGFTSNTTPDFTMNNGEDTPLTITDFGLRIYSIEYSILPDAYNTGAVDGDLYYDLYNSWDQYTIVESNGGSEYHNSTTTISASEFYLYTFNGVSDGSGNPLFTNWCALSVKSPYTNVYELTTGTSLVAIYYSSTFLGDVSDPAIVNDWSILTQGLYDHNYGETHVDTDELSYETMSNGIYFNNGCLFLRRISSAATTFTGYFVCPPPQLKVTAVVITPTATYRQDAYDLSGDDIGPSLQVYNPTTGTFYTQSYWVDVQQRSEDASYYPFSTFTTSTYYMNDLEFYEDASFADMTSIYTYRASQSYSKEVDIKENKFSIYEYSGLYMGDVDELTPYTYVCTDLNNTYISNLTETVGDVSFNSNGSYTISIKQDKSPLTTTSGERYSYENIIFTIGSPFIWNDSVTVYDASSVPTYEDRWVPVDVIGPSVMILDYNVGNATRLTLYGTNFSYVGDQYSLTLKRFRTNFGVDYSNFPREITSVIFYAKEKHTKTITFVRPDIAATVQNEGAINAAIAAQLASVSWSDTSYSWTLDNTFTEGNIKFELAPSVSHIYQQTSLYDASYTSAGVREILSYLAVTKDEPRNILFMNLQDSIREESIIYGDYLPKNITTYNGQYYSIEHDASNNYYINMSEK